MKIELDNKECMCIMLALNARINKCASMRDESTCEAHERYWDAQIKEARNIRRKINNTYKQE